MYKSGVIILGIVWMICTTYFSMTRLYGYPYGGAALAGSCLATLLLLASIIVYIKKHRN